MINTKKFYKSSSWSNQYKKLVMEELNEFIEENKIKRSDILEFRTHEELGRCSSFEIVISWWY